MIKSQALENLGLQKVQENSVTLVISSLVSEVFGRAFLLCQWKSKEEAEVTAYAVSAKYFCLNYKKTMPHAEVMTAMINARGGYNIQNWNVEHFDSLDEAINYATTVIKNDYANNGMDINLLYSAPVIGWYDGILMELRPACKDCPKSIICPGQCGNMRGDKPNEYAEFVVNEGENIYLTLKSTPVDDKELICVSKKSVDGLIVARLYVKTEGVKKVYKDFSGTPEEFSNYLKEFSTKFLEPKGSKWTPGD